MNTHISIAPSLHLAAARGGNPPRILLIALLAAVCSGCSTASLDTARNQFYAGQFQKAGATLAKADAPAKAKVLFLMERGTVRQAAGDYDTSSRDYIEAFDLVDRMTTISISEDTASMVINDSVQDYRGAPYERTLLHSFTAKNHLAEANWENAAVEARRIIDSLSPEAKGDYPDDAYSRYMAGFCLEMIDDGSNASLQYRKANEISHTVQVDDRTGRMATKVRESSTTNAPGTFKSEAIDTSPWPNELVCFVLAGRAPYGDTVYKPYSDTETYAEIYHDGKLLGRSYPLADTVDLAFTTQQKEAVRKMVKSAARIATKEAISNEIEHNNEALGVLVRFILIGVLEQPDVRRWETLPRWLEVARVPCPPDLKDFDVVYKTGSGVETRRIHVTSPIAHRRHTYVSFCRDIVPK